MAKPQANHKTADPRLAARHQEKAREMQQANMAAQRQGQRDQAIFNVQVRQMQALEAIAEALHVAYEPQIDAFRKRMVEKAEEDAKRVAAEAETAKAAVAPVLLDADGNPIPAPSLLVEDSSDVIAEPRTESPAAA